MTVKTAKAKALELRANSAEHSSTTNTALRTDSLACSNLLRLLAVRVSTSYVSNIKTNKTFLLLAASRESFPCENLLRHFSHVHAHYFRAIMNKAFFRHVMITFGLCNNSSLLLEQYNTLFNKIPRFISKSLF